MCAVSDGEDAFGEMSTSNASLHYLIKYNMRTSLDLDQEGCYLQVGSKESLQECGFNATAKTIFIIHGWTVGLNTKKRLEQHDQLFSLLYIFFA